MSSKCRGSESCYNRGCRSEQCKKAASDARRERRRLAREAVGVANATPGLDMDRTPLVSVPINNASTSVNADTSVVAAVVEEINGLAAPCPGLAAAALSMAAILDNPKATSTKPAAAKVLVSVLDRLQKASSATRRGNLALVRSMTSEKRT